jgi:hypothetical protein
MHWCQETCLVSFREVCVHGLCVDHLRNMLQVRRADRQLGRGGPQIRPHGRNINRQKLRQQRHHLPFSFQLAGNPHPAHAVNTALTEPRHSRNSSELAQTDGPSSVWDSASIRSTLPQSPSGLMLLNEQSATRPSQLHAGTVPEAEQQQQQQQRQQQQQQQMPCPCRRQRWPIDTSAPSNRPVVSPSCMQLWGGLPVPWPRDQCCAAFDGGFPSVCRPRLCSTQCSLTAGSQQVVGASTTHSTGHKELTTCPSH